ncbi:LysR family transcriptional regulator [Vibrio diabolicus]|uniref:LysR family transcriptional regulator n=1 Tax=Vibrio diabolicus TaxID=50719 RepID=UPI0029409343|nr:LysR family transcriptional regulator [Vibrio diabolicus]MDV5044135.1 LysR family transcriptional regulator [Vibrio diabolicus]
MKLEPFERVTLKMLRYFYEVAQTKHFTKAAENLNITNSPLSNRIKELEEVLNVKLFERDSRNVMLTEAGRLLESKCQLIFQTLDVSLNQVQQVGLNQRNILRVGVVSSAFWGGFDRLLQRFHAEHDTYHADIFDLNPETQKKHLSEKKIDVGIVRFADALNIYPYQSVSLGKDVFVVAVSEQHELASKSLLRLQDLKTCEFAFMSLANSASANFIINACLQEGFSPHIGKQVVEPSTLMAYVANSNTVTLVPSTFSQHHWHGHGIRFIKLKESLRADLCLIHDGKQESAIKAEFIRTLLENAS